MHESTSAKLAEQIKSQQSYKIREFEWFEVETKIRLFVQKLLEPTLKQIHEDRMVVDELQSNQKSNSKEVSYLREIVLNQGAGIPIFQEIKQKFQDLEMKLDENKRESIDQFGQLKQHQNQQDNEIQKFLQAVRNLEYFKIKLEQEMQDMQLRNENFKSSVESIIKQLSSDLTESTKGWKLEIIQIEQQFVKNENNHQDFNLTLKSEQQKIKQVQEQMIDINKKLTQNISQFEVIDNKLVKQDLSIQTLKKQLLDLDNLFEKSKQLQMYLIYYLPMYMQTQISDSLFTCLPVKFYYKLCQYEKQKFDHYDQELLKYNGEPDLQSLIDQYSKILEEVMKRNAKINQKALFQRKKINNDSGSSNSDNDSDQIKGSQNIIKSKAESKVDTNNVRKESIFSKDTNQQQIILSQQRQLAKSQVQNTNFVYFEEQVKQMKEQYQEQIDEVILNYNNLKKQITQVQKEMNDQTHLLQNHCQINSTKYVNQTQNQIKLLEENIKKLLSQESVNPSEVVLEQTKQVRKTLQTVLHFLVLITHLLIQDEIDRQGIQLMGARETQLDDGLVFTGNIQNRKGPSIQLNGDCLSCSGQSIQLLQFFKLACLAYHPSDIIVDGKQIKRDKLLEMCTALLKQAKGEFQDQDTSAAQRQRSSSIPISPGRLNTSFKFNKTRKLAPMTNLQNL